MPDPYDQPEPASAAMPWDQEFAEPAAPAEAEEGGSNLKIVFLAAAITFGLGLVVTLAIALLR